MVVVAVAIDSKVYSTNRFRQNRVTDTRQGHYTDNRQNAIVLVLLAINSMSTVTIVGVTIVIIIIAAILRVEGYG